MHSSPVVASDVEAVVIAVVVVASLSEVVAVTVTPVVVVASLAVVVVAPVVVASVVASGGALVVVGSRGPVVSGGLVVSPSPVLVPAPSDGLPGPQPAPSAAPMTTSAWNMRVARLGSIASAYTWGASESARLVRPGDRLSCVCMADPVAESSPRRPTLAVATIGHHRHGKTTLTAAISQVLARRSPTQAEALSVVQIDRRGGSPPLELLGERLVTSDARPPELPPVTLTVRAVMLRYATEHRSFVHIDSPGRRPWLKNAARAQALVDALILVVSAPDGVQAQTHEHLLLAQALGVRQLVVFLGKCDLVPDLEWLDMVEQEVRELLGRCGFDGDTTRIIRGAALPVCRGEAAWEPAIHDLIQALESDVEVAPRRVEGPPLLYLDHVFSRRPGGDAVIAEGRLRRGQLHRGDVLALVGMREAVRVKVTDLETNHRKLEQVGAGDFVGLQFHRLAGALRAGEVVSGQALVGPGGEPTRSFVARVDMLPPDNGGRRTPIRDGHLASFIFGTAVMSGLVRLGQPGPLGPGEMAEARVELRAPVYLEPGMSFLLRDGNQGPLVKDQPPRWAGSSGMGRVLSVDPVTT